MPLTATVVPPVVPLSWIALLAIVACLGASIAVYAALVHRWTAHRLWIDIAEWARAHGLKAYARPTALPEALRELAGKNVTVTSCLSGRATTLLQLETRTSSDEAAMPQRWHVLVRAIDAEWKPTGLRPSTASASLLDLFSLSSYPLMGETMRFTVYGTDTPAARALSKSHARALLPADIGLLLFGKHLILDFSTRPFDPITFERMMALSDQLMRHLPG